MFTDFSIILYFLKNHIVLFMLTFKQIYKGSHLLTISTDNIDISLSSAWDEYSKNREQEWNVFGSLEIS